MRIATPPTFHHAGVLPSRFASVDPRLSSFREERVDIDMRNCQFIGPAAVLWCATYPLLAAARGSTCQLLVPENMGVCVYLKSVGLFDALAASDVEVDIRGIRQRRDPQVVLPLTRFRSEAEVDEIANQALDSLSEAGLGSANIHPLVSEVFAELARLRPR